VPGRICPLPKKSLLIHEGGYVAEVEVEFIETDELVRSIRDRQVELRSGKSKEEIIEKQAADF
jgi:hypothetical protein